ncbi:MAG: hypothetical protein ACYDHU_05995 [Acidimicrobiales bacterium]
MTAGEQWSPDGPSGGEEIFEQGDEARDEAERLDPGWLEDIEMDPALDPTLQADRRELEQSGSELDDPEQIVTLEGGIDDPDGLGSPPGRARTRRPGEEGWDLDAPAAPFDGPADSDAERPGGS